MIKVLRFDGSLYACNALFFKRKFYELIGIRLNQKPIISVRRPETVEIQDNTDKYVVLDCSPLNFIDSVGVKLLIEVCTIHEA
jgi:ABC-type transporter Mla MlaB component